jgi:hypothetical protein
MTAAVAADRSLPVGEMFPRGQVKIEARNGVWKNVDTSPLSMFQDEKIKVEKGAASIALANNCQIEVGEDSLFFVGKGDEFHLVQGRSIIHIPSGAELNIQVRNLKIVSSNARQAGKSPKTFSEYEEASGFVCVRENGAVDVKSLRGTLRILDRNLAVSASLSPNELVALSPSIVEAKGEIILPQVGELTVETEGGGQEAVASGDQDLPDSARAGALGLGTIGLGGIIYKIEEERQKDRSPVCR